MVLETGGNFAYSLHAVLGLGVFTVPYLARTGGATLTALGLGLSYFSALALTRRITKLCKEKNNLAESLIEKPAEVCISLEQATAAVIPGSLRSYTSSLVQGLTLLYLLQVALYSLDFLSKLLPFWPNWVVWLLSGCLLTWTNRYSLAEAQTCMMVTAGLKLVLLVCVCLLSKRSAQVELTPDPASSWELASMLPFFLCFGLYHATLPHFSVSQSHFLGVAVGLGAVLGFSLWFQIVAPESPYFLPDVLQLWTSHWSVQVMALLFVLSTCYFHLQCLHDQLPTKQPLLPLILCSLLILREWVFPGPIENLLLLNPIGAILALSWACLFMQSASNKTTMGVGLGLALLDLTRHFAVLPLFLAMGSVWLVVR